MTDLANQEAQTIVIVCILPLMLELTWYIIWFQIYRLLYWIHNLLSLAELSKAYMQVMVPYRYEQFIEDLISLVESGEIQMSKIDDAVERILRVKFFAGLFEYPFSDRSLLDTIGCKVLNCRVRHSIC